MAAARAVVAVVPLHVEEEEVDGEVGRGAPLCVAEVEAPPAPLKLKIRLNDRDEVFQQWELLPEPEDEGAAEQDSSSWSRFKRGVCTRRINQEVPRSHVGFPIYYRGPPGFDLEEESTIQPARHSDAPAAELETSANILSIKVLSSTVGYPINLYGCVFVRDDLDRQRVYVFRRDRDNAQLVKSPDETLVLTGPSRGLTVVDNLFFEIDLKMRCDQEVDDIDFSQGRMHYNNRGKDRSMVLMDKLATKLSTVRITFAPVERAVEATIQIRVCKEFNVEFDKLCGKISAFITGISEEVVLFDSEASGAMIKIRDGGIELWRCVVSVPINVSLFLRVDTWEGAYKANLISSATVFTPRICGTDVASVHCGIQVKVQP
ncbi:hypothetical protein ACP70R_039052 [Stipagrostis hirtigluma subsp. patula]